MSQPSSPAEVDLPDPLDEVSVAALEHRAQEVRDEVERLENRLASNTSMLMFATAWATKLEKKKEELVLTSRGASKARAELERRKAKQAEAATADMVEANKQMALASREAAKASADAARWAGWAALFTAIAALITLVQAFKDKS